MRKIVARAREVQLDRYRENGQQFNSELKPGQIGRFCPLTPEASRMLEQAYSAEAECAGLSQGPESCPHDCGYGAV